MSFSRKFNKESFCFAETYVQKILSGCVLFNIKFWHADVLLLILTLYNTDYNVTKHSYKDSITIKKIKIALP